MSRDDQAVCGKIRVMITFVIGRVAKESTPGGPRGEFVWCGGGSARVTCTAKDAQMLVYWSRAEAGEVWTGSLNRRRWKMVQEVGGNVKTLGPITPGKGSLDKQCADDIIKGANNAFGFTILRGRVRTRHPELCSFGQKEGPGGRVVKLMPVVSLDGLNSAVELSSNLSKEIRECSEGVRFKFKWKSRVKSSRMTK
jgi:hypothetical protein